MFSVGGDFDKIGQITNMIDTVSTTLRSSMHVNDLVKSANDIITGEFVLHMSREALSKPKKFQHMYEWGQLGDPHGRLWKHILRGRGASRQLTWDFKASMKAVPVADKLAAVGVQKNHIFTWKAPVLELGLPVRISPLLAKYLVFLAKDNARKSAVGGTGFERNGIAYFNGTIAIDRQGSDQSWNAFTTEYRTWFTSGNPELAIRASISVIAGQTIKQNVLQKVASIATGKTKAKTFNLTPVGLDAGFQTKLENSLRANYIVGAANRRVLVAEDDI